MSEPYHQKNLDMIALLVSGGLLGIGPALFPHHASMLDMCANPLRLLGDERAPATHTIIDQWSPYVGPSATL